MASEQAWKSLRHFRPNGPDNFGDPNAIDEKLLFYLDDFRDYIGTPVIVTSGVRPDVPGKSSFHTRKKGSCAVDVVIPGYQKSVIDLLIDVTRFKFTGIGFYQGWMHKGHEVIGLHLDTRPSDVGARWIGFQERGKQVYGELSFKTLLEHFILDPELKSQIQP